MRRPGLGLVERLQRQLGERAIAAQIVPQAVQGMRPVQLVGAVGGDDEQRQFAQRERQRAKQLDRGVVGPLQVVEQHRRRPFGGERGEPAADRLHERGAVAARARLAQLRQQHGEMTAQRAAAVEPARGGPQELAERPDDRPVGRAVGRGRTADEAHAERLVRQPRLSDARLAGDEQQPAAPVLGILERGAEPRCFRLAADQHAASLRPAQTGSERGPVRSKTAVTSATRLAGKPPRLACSRITSALSASWTQ